jgi:hypothetical protein
MMHVYSQDSPVGELVAFLDGIATEILELNGNADDFMGLGLLSDSVTYFGFLAEFDYLLIHELISISILPFLPGRRLALDHRLFLVVVVGTTGIENRTICFVRSWRC